MFTVYKITNLVNMKTYIGVHKTLNPNDSYMGSGLAIKAAIEKYGLEKFDKEILLVTDSKDEAYALEHELTADFHVRDNYNMKRGGVGGFSSADASKGFKARARNAALKAKSLGVGIHSLSKEQLANQGRITGLKNKGRPLSEAHKQAISDVLKRKKANKAV